MILKSLPKVVESEIVNQEPNEELIHRYFKHLFLIIIIILFMLTLIESQNNRKITITCDNEKEIN